MSLRALIAVDQSNREIARSLFVSEATGGLTPHHQVTELVLRHLPILMAGQ